MSLSPTEIVLVCALEKLEWTAAETVPVPILPSPSTRTWTARECVMDFTKPTHVAYVRSLIRREKLLKIVTAMIPALEQLPWIAVVYAMEEIR